MQITGRQAPKRNAETCIFLDQKGRFFVFYLYFCATNPYIDMPMEQLLHYVWKHKLFATAPLKTTEGVDVEVIDVGLHNDNAGADFFNAKVKLGDTLWVGNVEIHDMASQWFEHGHHNDPRYNNVVLHVVGKADMECLTQDGKQLPQMELAVPKGIAGHYDELLATDKFPPCHHIIPQLQRLTLHSWLAALQTERLESKTEAVVRRVEQAKGSWEDAFFITLARNFGFGVNGDAFERWAANVPLRCVDHHRDNAFQIEALFMGQAGLLNDVAIPARHPDAATAESYFELLKKEYAYLAHKFNLQPLDPSLWLFLRLRPQNFPHIRLSQLAVLHHSRRASLANIVACENLTQLRKALVTQVSPYWQTHYVFGGESKASDKALSTASRDVLILNTVAPVLFAYGRHRHNDILCDRAYQLLDELKAEDNHIVRMWKACGLEVNNAGDTQALIQLKNEYCDRKNCLRCRIGYEYLRR